MKWAFFSSLFHENKAKGRQLGERILIKIGLATICDELYMINLSGGLRKHF